MAANVLVRVLGPRSFHHVRTVDLVRTFGTSRTLSQVSSEAKIEITDACASQLKEIASENEFLRLEVEGGGCSGFQYKFKIDHNMNESDDLVFVKDGAKVVVDQTSLQLVNGSVIDYKKELIRSAFIVGKNPNAQAGCSCGASFTVKLD